jgi:hypothetical protein
VQKLGHNHGGYHGERLDIRALLREISAAAKSHGWTQELFHETEKFQWPALHRQPATFNQQPATKFYISAGIHGDEPAGPLAALKLIQENRWPDHAEIFLLPCLNPDGFAFNTRAGRDGTDLNRDYLRPQCASTRAHIAWLEQQPQFDFYLCLHEDWEAHGFYLYEQNPDGQRAAGVPPADQISGGRAKAGSAGKMPAARCPTSLAEKIISAVEKICPIDRSEKIDGRPARDGIIRPGFDPAARPDWPESWWLLHHRTRLGCTLEAPSDFAMSVRVNALVTAVNAAVNFSTTACPAEA